jgi:fructokinase
MLIGIDWGGTKIDGVALTPDGQQIARSRAETPRHDYEGCLRTIADLVARMEAETGRRGTIGIGIPGSLEPRSRLAKGASSTWLRRSSGPPIATAAVCAAPPGCGEAVQ